MNIWLKIFLAVSIICILITRYFWVNTPEFWEYGKETGDIVRDLSVGFIAAFIFYVIDIWFPNKEKKERINGQIAIPLSRLLNHMKGPIEFTVNKYLDEKINISSISTIQLKNSIKKVDVIAEEGPMFFMDKNRNASFLEYLIVQVDKVNQYSKQLYELPLEKDVGLITIVDRIRNSSYHQGIESLGEFWESTHRISDDYFSASFPEYLELYRELHNFMKENKIKLTISDL